MRRQRVLSSVSTYNTINSSLQVLFNIISLIIAVIMTFQFFFQKNIEKITEISAVYDRSYISGNYIIFSCSDFNSLNSFSYIYLKTYENSVETRIRAINTTLTYNIDEESYATKLKSPWFSFSNINISSFTLEVILDKNLDAKLFVVQSSDQFTEIAAFLHRMFRLLAVAILLYYLFYLVFFEDGNISDIRLILIVSLFSVILANMEYPDASNYNYAIGISIGAQIFFLFYCSAKSLYNFKHTLLLELIYCFANGFCHNQNNNSNLVATTIGWLSAFLNGLILVSIVYFTIVTLTNVDFTLFNLIHSILRMVIIMFLATSWIIGIMVPTLSDSIPSNIISSFFYNYTVPFLISISIVQMHWYD